LRAIAQTDCPLSKLSATIRAFSSAVKTRRLRKPEDDWNRFAGDAVFPNDGLSGNLWELLFCLPTSG
jgi:hypothetical protein